ncbi:hypothetical protein [Jiangella sp. DSM 45060]|uniref:hypothetical protein n=1 Tax=Jiangella sp. DSM 45060 TaxID=1798224 RepID=UPI0008792B85|nr:hypothetical protein [Jiangella sp. DSM 45060]SDT65844.1 hypothetical protein SAMN04515669_5540 [Jiangella sp. DSM 45060]
MSDHDLETALRATLAGRAADAPAGDDLADTVTRVGLARRRRRRVAGAATVLAVGALAGLAGRGLVPVAGDAEPQPAASTPADVATGLVTCNMYNGWPPFDPTLLTERPALDPESDLGIAVRTTARPSIAARLIDRWTLIDQVGSTAYLLIWLKDTEETRNMVDGGLATAVYTQASDGSWAYQGGGGGCEPQRYFDDGLMPGWWSLRTVPGADDTSVDINVNSDECSSGQSPADRLTEPIVEYTADAVLITARVEPLAYGAYTCQGSPSAPLTVHLDEPLGDRQLLDGQWYPPRPVTTEP